MLGRTKLWVPPLWVVYELDKGRKRLTRKAVCLAMRSRIRKRRNVRHARLGYRPSGGEHRGRYLVMPCVRIAGKHVVQAGRLKRGGLTIRANYRKYGVISFTKAEDSKKPLEKLEPKTKKQKVSHSHLSRIEYTVHDH